jgi:CHAT domain-containing protein
VLAGANRHAAGADGEDGLLTAEEIGAMDLARARWVVLSACDTGLGTIVAGEGVFGLRRAFALAGAGTLVMSLWNVGDAATRRWMSELYAGRARGLSAAHAARAASRAVLKDLRDRGDSTHPATWGAFIVSGDSK